LGWRLFYWRVLPKQTFVSFRPHKSKCSSVRPETVPPPRPCAYAKPLFLATVKAAEGTAKRRGLDSGQEQRHSRIRWGVDLPPTRNSKEPEKGMAGLIARPTRNFMRAGAALRCRAPSSPWQLRVQASGHRHTDQARQTSGPGFLHHAGPVDFHSPRAEPQFPRNQLIGAADE
jgi:hypothetical protein